MDVEGRRVTGPVDWLCRCPAGDFHDLFGRNVEEPDDEAIVHIRVVELGSHVGFLAGWGKGRRVGWVGESGRRVGWT